MNNASIILFIVGTVVLIFSFSLKMSNFLDVRSIFLEHFSVFKGNPLQLVSIFIVPVLFSIGILNIRCVDSGILNNLNITLSILIAMFFSTLSIATVYKGNIIKNLIMDCQSYTKYRPNETTGGIFVSWRRKEELPTGA